MISDLLRNAISRGDGSGKMTIEDGGAVVLTSKDGTVQRFSPEQVHDHMSMFTASVATMKEDKDLNEQWRTLPWPKPFPVMRGNPFIADEMVRIYAAIGRDYSRRIEFQDEDFIASVTA